MASLKLDLDPTSATFGDLALSGGHLVLTDDATGETVKQAVACRLRLFLGEWFLDTRQGVDYFGRVLIKNPDLAVVEALLKAEVLDTPDVVKILGYSQTYSPSARTLSVEYSAQISSGEVVSDIVDIAVGGLA